MSSIRGEVERELAETIDRSKGSSWEFERRNFQRTADWWMMSSLTFAVRKLHLGRYRDDYELHEAILELREVVSRVANLIRKNYMRRYDAWQQKETDHE